MTRQHLDECLGGVLDTLHQVLPVAKLAGPQPIPHLSQGLRVLFLEVPHQKPLDLGPLDDQVSQPARPLLGTIQVVLRALAADGHSGLEVEQCDHGIGDRAAQVVEVDVNAVGTSGRQAVRAMRFRTPNQRPMESHLLPEVACLGLRAGHANHPASLDLGNLSDSGSHGSGGPRDHHRFSRLRLADAQQSKVGRQSGHPQDAQRRGKRFLPRLHSGQRFGRDDRLLLPTQISQHRIAGLKTRMVGDHHPSHDLTHQHLPHLYRFRIGFAVVHAPAHIGIEGKIDPADQAFSRTGDRKPGVDRLEVGQLWHSPGASRQDDFSAGGNQIFFHPTHRCTLTEKAWFIRL